jgi:hypothetical protein
VAAAPAENASNYDTSSDGEHAFEMDDNEDLNKAGFFDDLLYGGDKSANAANKHRVQNLNLNIRQKIINETKQNISSDKITTLPQKIEKMNERRKKKRGTLIQKEESE